MINKEQLSELEATHKRIAHVQGKGTPTPWEVVLRKPTRAEYKHYRSQSNNPAQTADAQEILVRKLVVHPSAEAFDVMLEEWPGIAEACGNAISILAGFSAAADAK